MLKDDYRELFDSISPDPLLSQQTEREITKMLHQNFKPNLRRTLCIAVAAVILVLGAAFAAVNASSILGRLFGDNEPSQTAIEAVVRDSMEASENGLTLNLDEYLFDRSSLHLGWTVSSERENPVFYTTAYEFCYDNPDDMSIAEESVGGSYGSYSSNEVGDGQMVCLDDNLRAYSGHAGYVYNGSVSSTITAHIVIHAYETDYAITTLPEGVDAFDLLEGGEIVTALEEAKQIGIADALTSVYGYQTYEAALDSLIGTGMIEDEAYEAAFVESGIFREVATLEIEIPVMPDTAAEPRFELASECSFELSDATVTVKALKIDTASTCVEYEVATDKEFDEANVIGNEITYILFDQDGHPLNADYMMSMSCGLISNRNVWFVSLEGNPLPESISAITFVPTCSLERIEGEATNDCYLRMRQNADAAQCFTIVLEQ